MPPSSPQKRQSRGVTFARRAAEMEMERHWIRRMPVPKEERDAMLTTSSRRFVTVLLFAAIATTAGAAFPRAAQDKNAQDKKLGDEQEIGKQVFNELKAKTEIVNRPRSTTSSCHGEHVSGGRTEQHGGADLTGADVCAASGYNPWGLVWLFQDFDNADPAQIPQLLSDHPDNPHRVQALKQHFRENPKVFGGFSADIKSAKPFNASKDAPEVFLR
jgi:hypothetical protein